MRQPKLRDVTDNTHAHEHKARKVLACVCVFMQARSAAIERESG